MFRRHSANSRVLNILYITYNANKFLYYFPSSLLIKLSLFDLRSIVVEYAATRYIRGYKRRFVNNLATLFYIYQIKVDT